MSVFFIINFGNFNMQIALDYCNDELADQIMKHRWFFVVLSSCLLMGKTLQISGSNIECYH